MPIKTLTNHYTGLKKLQQNALKHLASVLGSSSRDFGKGWVSGKAYLCRRTALPAAAGLDRQIQVEEDHFREDCAVEAAGRLGGRPLLERHCDSSGGGCWSQL